MGGGSAKSRCPVAHGRGGWASGWRATRAFFAGAMGLEAGRNQKKKEGPRKKGMLLPRPGAHSGQRHSRAEDDPRRILQGQGRPKRLNRRSGLPIGRRWPSPKGAPKRVYIPCSAWTFGYAGFSGARLGPVFERPPAHGPACKGGGPYQQLPPRHRAVQPRVVPACLTWSQHPFPRPSDGACITERSNGIPRIRIMDAIPFANGSCPEDADAVRAVVPRLHGQKGIFLTPAEGDMISACNRQSGWPARRAFRSRLRFSFGGEVGSVDPLARITTPISSSRPRRTKRGYQHCPDLDRQGRKEFIADVNTGRARSSVLPLFGATGRLPCAASLRRGREMDRDS